MADDDDQWLLTREATELLSARLGYEVSQETLRRYATAGHLRVARPPSTGPGHSRRRFSSNSIIDLATVMKMPPGPERDEAMAALKDKNS
ncbi:hypothetical protein ABZS66_19345 [Dactylosporangium sp. NPDC005572]|uniref:hypothetical protein n=1 Tax=Dactylosporangium sp. NPDC005572 TaxID=3156889 RepID=UPI0033B327BB